MQVLFPCHGIGLVVCLVISLAHMAQAADPIATAGPQGYFMEARERFMVPTAQQSPMPTTTITKASYLTYLDTNCADVLSYAMTCDFNVFGTSAPAAALPMLAKYEATGQASYGNRVKLALQAFHTALNNDISTQGWFSPFSSGMLIGVIELEIKILLKGGILTTTDEQGWVQEMILAMNRNMQMWGDGWTLGRGSAHRAVEEGVSKMYAVLRYPTIPEAAAWTTYSNTVWNDWWNFRDFALNDTGYMYSAIQRALLGAYLIPDRNGAFTDTHAKDLFDRMMYEITPDGAVPPYGYPFGWNSGLPDRIWMLELIARMNRDGRYRWAAHRLMNYMMSQAATFAKMRSYTANGVYEYNGISLAYIFADDTVTPVEPSGASRMTTRNEIRRITEAKNLSDFIVPGQQQGRLESSVLMLDTHLPDKLILRSGWNVGDLYMLVELFPRYVSIQTGAILAMTQYGNVFTTTEINKELSPENRLIVEDRGGTAAVGMNPDPANYYDEFYMDVAVNPLIEKNNITYAKVSATGYMSFPMNNDREFLFVKNRFALVKDTATFTGVFDVRLGQNWKTQNISPTRGANWVNTYFSRPYDGYGIGFPQAPWDLLVYYAPQASYTLHIANRYGEDSFSWFEPYNVRYAWSGTTSNGMKLNFTQLLLPHAPTRDATTLVNGITTYDDTPDLTVIKLVDSTRGVTNPEEWAVLNNLGAALTRGSLETDAYQVYLDVRDGAVTKATMLGGTYLKWGGAYIFQTGTRQDGEL
ncbi:MAG: hypothetical protein ACYC7E_10570 [Armatimonadota bacterium]